MVQVAGLRRGKETDVERLLDQIVKGLLFVMLTNLGFSPDSSEEPQEKRTKRKSIMAFTSLKDHSSQMRCWIG